jgi:hypothetical protein
MPCASTPIWRNCPSAEGMAPQKKRPDSVVARPLTSGAPRCVQHAPRLGQQRAEVRAEAGREITASKRSAGDCSKSTPYGLMSGGAATSFVAMALGALAIASAAYLILDLSSPYSGIFRVSSAPLEQVLALMGKE